MLKIGVCILEEKYGLFDVWAATGVMDRVWILSKDREAIRLAKLRTLAVPFKCFFIRKKVDYNDFIAKLPIKFNKNYVFFRVVNVSEITDMEEVAKKIPLLVVSGQSEEFKMPQWFFNRVFINGIPYTHKLIYSCKQ